MAGGVESGLRAYSRKFRHTTPCSSIRCPFAGRAGCIVACMKHMEKKDAVKNQFKEQKGFSDKKPWALPERPPHVEHHGFVYDPKYQTSKDGKDKFAPPQDWY